MLQNTDSRWRDAPSSGWQTRIGNSAAARSHKARRRDAAQRRAEERTETP